MRRERERERERERGGEEGKREREGDEGGREGEGGRSVGKYLSLNRRAPNCSWASSGGVDVPSY